jgi:thiol:disulfide interchange protein
MNENKPLSPFWVLLPAALVVVCIAGVVADRTAVPQAPRPAPVIPAGLPEEDVAHVNTPKKPVKTQPVAEPEAKKAAPEIVSQWTTLESALAESRQNGKPVLLDFNAEWCGPCRRMKQDLFDGSGGRAVQTAVIPVSIVDRAREDGKNPADVEGLQQRYQVGSFPTLVVFNPETGKSLKAVGFADPDRTLQWITAAAQAVR